MKVFLQSERAECGLMCLAMVAHAYGIKVDRATLASKCRISSKGLDLSQMIDMAPRLGLTARAVRFDLKDLRRVNGPCILHWDFDHFVVFAGFKGNRLKVLDPACGVRYLSIEAASPKLTGPGLVLMPIPNFKVSSRPQRIDLQHLVGHVQGLRSTMLTMFALALAIELVAVLSPFVSQLVIDGALVSGDRGFLLLAILGGVLLAGADTTLRVFRDKLTLYVGQQLSLQWTSNLFSHVMRLPLQFFERRNLGDISSRFTSLNAIQKCLIDGAISASLDGLLAVLTLSLMFVYSPKLSWIALSAVILYGLLRVASFRAFRVASEERISLSSREQSTFLETIRSVQSLKLANGIPHRLAHWQSLRVDVQNRDATTQNLSLVFSSANRFIFAIEGMLLLYFGGVVVLDGALTLGMLLAFLAYKTQFGSRASRLFDVAVDIAMLSLHTERLAEVVLEDVECEPTAQIDSSIVAATIQFLNVSFQYGESEPWILRNVSFDIGEGQAVAIVGSSGSGKSTLLKIALGLLQPTEGEVRIGGVPLTQLGLDGARRICAAVMQDDTLLSGSIFENIAGFVAQPSGEAVQAAAALAQVADEIYKMPMGFQTLISDGGIGLSGGQRQRILLARALFRKPRILVLDEATCHLDRHNERLLIEALCKLSLTRIVVAHRQETIATVDRIIGLSAGRIEYDVAAQALLVGVEDLGNK